MIFFQNVFIHFDRYTMKDNIRDIIQMILCCDLIVWT